MYLHAESIMGKLPLPGDGAEDKYDERLVAFLRFGNDINENYYQIEKNSKNLSDLLPKKWKQFFPA